MNRRAAAAIAVLAGVLIVTTSCGVTNGGSATPVSTDKVAATAALWDPCTQIGEATLRQVGVDPSTRDNTISGVENVKGWKQCSWHDKPSAWDYELGVWSTIYTLDDFKKDEKNVDFTDISIAGRVGVQFRRAYDREDEICYLGFSSASQTIQVSIHKTFTTRTRADDRRPCVIAASAAEILAPMFPK